MKITEKEKKIEEIDDEIKKLIEKTKAGKQTKSDYLREVQVLKPERKRLRNQLSQLIFKKNRTPVKESIEFWTKEAGTDGYIRYISNFME